MRILHATCARQIGLLPRLRNVLSKPAVKRIFTGFIRPRLEYASAIWSGGNITKLLKLQEKFCKRHRLTLPALNTRLEYHTLLLFLKICQNTTPSYLSAILSRTFNDSTTSRLRKMNYPFPGVRKTSSLNGFFPRAIEMWNNLPVQIQQSNSVQLFKRNLRAHLQLADWFCLNFAPVNACLTLSTSPTLVHLWKLKNHCNSQKHSQLAHAYILHIRMHTRRTQESSLTSIWITFLQ